MDEEDEIIEVNNKNFSLRKILQESGWEKYTKTTDKVRKLVKLKVTLDLCEIEKGFMELNKYSNKENDIEK